MRQAFRVLFNCNDDFEDCFLGEAPIRQDRSHRERYCEMYLEST